MVNAVIIIVIVIVVACFKHSPMYMFHCCERCNLEKLKDRRYGDALRSLSVVHTTHGYHFGIVSLRLQCITISEPVLDH
jgi:hypothetical protein